MVVIGWNFDNINGPNANGYYTNLFGGPKVDAIFISQAQQAWETWDFTTAPEWQTIKEAYQTPMPPDGGSPQFDDQDIPIFWYDFGLKIPHFEERVDIFKRSYSINDVTLKLSNAENTDISGGLNLWGIKNIGMINNVSTSFIKGRIKGSFKFSDILKIKSVTNENVVVFLKSPSAKEWKDLLPIYAGIVTGDSHSTDSISISLEDISEVKVKNQYPTTLMSSLGGSSTDRNKDKPVPMIYGNVNMAPTHYIRIPFENFEGTQAVDTGHQDIFYLDTQPLKGLQANNVTIGTQEIHQSYLYFWDEGYWNVSKHTADSNGDTILPENGGMDNFWENNDNNQIYMIGSAQQTIRVTHDGNIITLQTYGEQYYNQDTNLDTLYDLYYGTNTVPGDEDTETWSPADNTPVNLFNLQNDTVQGKLRVHGFAKPENVNVRVTRAGSTALHQPLSIKSYESQAAHNDNIHDLSLDLKKAYNWGGMNPDTSSFVELKGRVIARYGSNSGYRTFEYPTFSVDFGNGTLPFNSYEVITDTAYHMKSVLQCTHPASFGIYKGSIAVWCDIGASAVGGLSPSVRFPLERDKWLLAPGEEELTRSQAYQWVIDTIDGPESNLATDLELQIDVTNIFENTSQYAQQDGEINVGLMEYALHNNPVNWNANYGHAITAESYTDGCHCVGGSGNNEASCDNSGGTWTCPENGHNYMDFSKGSGWDFTMRLYHISAFSTILVDKDPQYDFYVSAKGRRGNTAEEQGSNEEFILSPHGILYNIARTEFKVPHMSDTDLSNSGQLNDVTKASGVHSELGLVQGFSINDQMSGKELLEGIAQSSLCVPSFDSLGRFKVNSMQTKYTYSDAIPIDSTDVIKFTISRTPISKVYTKVVLKYNFDYRTEEYTKTIEKTVSDFYAENRLSASYQNENEEVVVSDYSYSFFNFNAEDEKVLTLESPYIRSESELNDAGFQTGTFEDKSAIALSNFLLSFYANQHTIFKITIPFGKYLHVQIGDVVRLTELLGEGNTYAYGEDYTKVQTRNGQYVYPAFYITKVKKRLDKGIEIECVQMHYLNIAPTATNDHGWVEPDALEYLIFGCMDDGNQEDSEYPGYAAMNYDPYANTPVPCLYRGDLDSSGRIDWIDVALLQLKIADNDVLLGLDPGTTIFRQHDINQDSIIDIRDIYDLTVIIMNNVQGDNYGCMDCGDPHGTDWGPVEWPVANNCDWDALVHDQTLCEYSTYACGPEKYDINWCKTDTQAYDTDNCLGPQTGSGSYNDDDLRDLMVADTYFSDVWSKVAWCQDNDDEFNSNWRFAINEEGYFGVPSGEGNNYQPTFGYYGGAWRDFNHSNQEHNWLSPIHVYWGNIRDANINAYHFEHESQDSIFAQTGDYNDNLNVISPTFFTRIILKAGHRYLFCSRDGFGATNDAWNFDNLNHLGMGFTYYIGSWQQHPYTLSQIEESYGQGADLPHQPVYNMATLGSMRNGYDDVWGNTCGDGSGYYHMLDGDAEATAKVFTAETDGTKIPIHSDDVGANNNGYFAGNNSQIIYDSFLDDNLFDPYCLSPDRQLFNLREWYENEGPWEGGLPLGKSYKDAAGAAPMLHGQTAYHHGWTSGGAPSELMQITNPLDSDPSVASTYYYHFQGGDMLPFGKRYETNLCCTVHLPLRELNMPYGDFVGDFGNCDINMMDFVTIIDLTDNPEFEETILNKLGYCNDSAYGDLTNGGE